MSESESNSVDQGEDTEMSDSDVKFDCQDCLCKMDPFPGQDVLTSLEDEDPFCKGAINTSTPLKRRSISLIDMRNVGDFHKPFNALCTSTDTIATNSSFSKSKDSGYHQTGSLLSVSGDQASLNRSICKSLNNYPIGEFDDSRKLHSTEELWKELEFNRVLIKALQENNINLKLKNAEAENKINELRLQSSLHCGCCSKKSVSKSSGTYLDSNSGVHPLFRKFVRQPFEKKPRPMSDIYEPGRSHSFAFSLTQSAYNTKGLPSVTSGKSIQTEVIADSESEMPPDDSQSKVLRWQDSIFKRPLESLNMSDLNEGTQEQCYTSLTAIRSSHRLSAVSVPSSNSSTPPVEGRQSSFQSPTFNKLRPQATGHKVYSLLDLQSTEEKVKIEERIKERIKSISSQDRGEHWSRERNSSSEESCGLVGKLITREKKDCTGERFFMF